MSDYLTANNLNHLDSHTKCIVHGYARQFQPLLSFDITSEIISVTSSYVGHHFMLDRGWYEWNINTELFQKMMTAKNRDKFESVQFKIAGLNWNLQTFPNGWKMTNAGSFYVVLHLLSMPSSWKSMSFHLRLYCTEAYASFNRVVMFKSDQKTFSWNDDALFLHEVKKIQSTNLTVGVHIRILQIMLRQNDMELYKQPIQYSPLESQHFEWTINAGLMKIMKVARHRKQFHSPLFDDMWCLWVCPNGNDNIGEFLLTLDLCALPIHPTLIVTWKVSCPQLNLQLMHTNEFNINEYSSWDWGDSRLTFYDFKKLDTITFNVEISYEKVKDDFLATNKWKQYAREIERRMENKLHDCADKQYKNYSRDIEVHTTQMRDAMNMQNATVMKEIQEMKKMLAKQRDEIATNRTYNDLYMNIVIKKSHLIYLIVLFVGMVIARLAY